ncbi:MAG TPA: PEP-CTERM sorting domain-containing protein [Pirellulales bacterium]
MQRLLLLNFCAACVGWAVPASAGVVTLAFGPEVYNSGDTTGYVDLTISGDPFQSYSLQVTITGDVSNSPTLGYELEFASIADISTDTFQNGYVFGSDSDDRNSTSPLLGNTTPDSFDFFTTLTAGDFTDSGNDVQPGSPNDLLVRLDFQLPANSLQGKFDISVSSNTGLTSFANANGDTLTISGAPSDTVTVGMAAAPLSPTPEPGTCGMLLVGMTGLALAQRRRRRAGAPPA